MSSVGELAAAMVGAAKTSLGKDWSKTSDFAKPEFERLARSLVDIETLAAAAKVNEQQARALFTIHRNTTQIVLLTIKGMGIVGVENAINAAIGAVRDTVNTSVGFALV